MQKKFLTNLILLLSLNLIVKPFYIFGIDRTVQNTVGSEDYGFYFAVFSFSFLFNILLDFGITQFNNRNIAQNNQLLNKHFSGILIMKLLLAIVFGVVTFSVALIIGYRSEQLYILGFLVFNQFLISFIFYLRSNISGLLLFKTDSLLSVLDRILMIIICGVLLWGGITEKPFNILWFVYAQSAAYFLTALIALIVVIKKAKFKKLNWNRAFFLMILKQSYPFAILVLLMSFYNRVDSVIIERILPDPLGDEQAGVYAHAFRLLDAFNMIAFLFAVLLLPIFSRLIKQKENIEHLVKLAFTLLFTISVIVAITSCFFREEIMKILYDDYIPKSAEVYGVLMFGFIPISTTYVFGTLLTANGSLKQLNIVAGSGMVISIVLNLILVPMPSLLALGSAYASLSSQLITAIAQLIVAYFLFKFRINWRFILQLFAFAGGVLLTGILIHHLSDNWILNMGGMIIISLIIALLLRLLNVKELLRIIKEKETGLPV